MAKNPQIKKPDQIPLGGFDISNDNSISYKPDITVNEKDLYYDRRSVIPDHCGATSPSGGWSCTRVKGHYYEDDKLHGGMHLAGNGDQILAAW